MKQHIPRRSLALLPGITSALLLCIGLSAQAASSTWINSGGGSWTVPGNWNGDVIADGADFTADFGTLDLTADAAVTLDGARTLGNLTFGDTTPSHNWSLATGTGGPLTLAVTTGSPTVTVNNQAATLSLVLAGTQGLTKAGAGTLTLSGANTYSGGATISAGKLVLGNAAGLGTAAATVASGATLDLAGFSSTNVISVSGTGLGAAGALINSTSAASSVGTLKLNADASAVNATADSSKLLVVNGTLDLSGQTLTISSGALNVPNPRSITSGNIAINNGGVLYLTGNGGSLMDVTGTITVNTGGAVDTRDANNTAMTTLHTIALNGGKLGNGLITGNNGGGAGAVLKNSVNVDAVNGGILASVNPGGWGLPLYLSGSLSGSGALSIQNNGVEFRGDVSGYTGTATGVGGTITFNGAASQTFNGVLAGSRPVVKNGTNPLTFTANNTYSGATTVNAGELVGASGGSCSNTTVTVANFATNGVQLLAANGQWTCGNLVMGSAAAAYTYCDFNFSSFAPSTTVAPLRVNGNLTLASLYAIIIRNAALSPGQYPLLQYGGTLTGTPQALPWSIAAGVTAYISNNIPNKSIDLVVTGTSYPTSIWATTSGEWDINTTQNWTNSSGAQGAYLDGNAVVFNDPGIASTVGLNTNVIPASVVSGVAISNVATYTISGTGVIGGKAGLTKAGSGELTLV